MVMNIDEELKAGRPTSSQMAKESAHSKSNAFVEADVLKVDDLNEDVQ